MFAFSPRRIALLLSLALAACTHEPREPDREPEPAPAPEPDRARDGGAPKSTLAACAAFGGEPPASIEDVLARLNQLPAPPSLECLLASLPRPLSLAASSSPFSLQPASVEDPRLFILYESLTLSIVLAGDGKDFLEFGERFNDHRSVKGELQFPVETPLAADAPYESVLRVGQPLSRCGICHANEKAHATLPGVTVSEALRIADGDELDLAALRRLRERCDDDEPAAEHCSLLRALFDYGQVRQGRFDPALGTL